MPKTWNIANSLPEPEIPEIEIDCMGRDDEDVLHEIIRQVYDIEIDDRLIHEAAVHNEVDRARNFDTLRNNYRTRREFSNTEVSLENASDSFCHKVEAMGFPV